MLRLAARPDRLRIGLRLLTDSRCAAGDIKPSDVPAARHWLVNFKPETIPTRICDISFSRSSGPGGQNVNKYEQLSVWPFRVPVTDGAYIELILKLH